MVNMPLFEVAFPDLSKAVIDQLIIIATFDLLPAADLMIKVSGEEPAELEDDNRFVEVGYDFEEFIMNLGTLFITFLVILMIPCCLLCVKPFKHKSRWLNKKYKGLSDSIHGNLFIRYILEGCLDISICAMLNFVSKDGLKWESGMHLVNNIFLIFLSVIVIAFPIWVFWFYCKRFAKWEDKKFQSHYGAIFEGLKTNQKSSLAYPMIFLIRRFILIFVAKVTQTHFFVQLSSTVIVSFIQVSYLVAFQPFEEPLMQKLEIFNEVTTILVIDFLSYFSYANQDSGNVSADIFLILLIF